MVVGVVSAHHQGADVGWEVLDDGVGGWVDGRSVEFAPGHEQRPSVSLNRITTTRRGCEEEEEEQHLRGTWTPQNFQVSYVNIVRDRNTKVSSHILPSSFSSSATSVGAPRPWPGFLVTIGQLRTTSSWKFTKDSLLVEVDQQKQQQPICSRGRGTNGPSWRMRNGHF